MRLHGPLQKVTKIREFWHDTVSHEGATLKSNNTFEYSDQALSSKSKRNYHPQIFFSLELIRLMPQNAQAPCNVAMVMIIAFSLCVGLWVICVSPINANGSCVCKSPSQRGEIMPWCTLSSMWMQQLGWQLLQTGKCRALQPLKARDSCVDRLLTGTGGKGRPGNLEFPVIMLIF